jgi:hypothetical protein
MTKLVFALTGAAILALTIPVAAQVGVDVGPGGVGVHLGGRPHYRDYDRDRDYRLNRYRDEYRERRHVRECDTFWRHGERVTVCHHDRD